VSHFFTSSLGLLATPSIMSPHLASPVTSLHTDPTDRYLLSCSTSGVIALYDLNPSGAISMQSPMPIPPLPDGVMLSALQMYERSVKWAVKARRRKPLVVIPRSTSASMPGHKNGVTRIRWYAGDNGMFLSGDFGGNIVLWDTNSCKPVITFPGVLPDGQKDLQPGVTCIAFPKERQSSTTFAVTTVTGRCLIYDMLSPTPVMTLPASRTSCTVCSYVAGSEHVIATAGGVGDGSVMFWDVRRSGSTKFFTSCQETNSALFDADGDETSTGTTTTTSRAGIQHAPSDTRNHTHAHRLPASSTGIAALNFTPCGKYAVTLSCVTGFVRVWDCRGVFGDTSLESTHNGSLYTGTTAIASSHDFGADYAKPVLIRDHTHLGGGAGNEGGGSSEDRRSLGNKFGVDFELLPTVSGGGLRDLCFISPLSNKRSDLTVGSVFCDAVDATTVNCLEGHLSPVKSLSVTGDGHVISGSSDGMILAWGYNGERRKKKAKSGEGRGDVDNW
jgi:WD40 repeat protein